MNSAKIGGLIRTLRREQGLTQKQLAQRLFVTGKTVSKWENGRGCPDPSLWSLLAEALGVGVEELLRGELSPNDHDGGNMKKTRYYVCQQCGSLILSTGEASVQCCGRKLEPLEPRRAAPQEELRVEQVEDDWYITSGHPMEKENYISFVAFVTGDRVFLCKQYPEWELQVRIPRRGHGLLLWYSTTLGLFRQLL